MTIYTKQEVKDHLVSCEYSDCARDNEGQLVFYTGIFEWEDGTFHDEPEPD